MRDADDMTAVDNSQELEETQQTVSVTEVNRKLREMVADSNSGVSGKYFRLLQRGTDSGHQMEDSFDPSNLGWVDSDNEEEPFVML